MMDRGLPALEASKHQNSVFKQVKLILPHLTFDQGQLSLRVGKKNLILIPSPGHSEDSISILIEEDRVLFAGDAFLPLPYIVDGDIEQLIATIKIIGKMGLENIVQGHGDIILRGEIDDSVKSNLSYLNAIRKVVKSALRRKNPIDILSAIDVESCGKSRILLGGLAEDLHKHNLIALYRQSIAEMGEIKASAPEDKVSF
jgi:glyoxylase-like metal-dependent hydrolase (beta-lactamase superfamily II)